MSTKIVIFVVLAIFFTSTYGTVGKHQSWLAADTFIDNTGFPTGSGNQMAELDGRVYVFWSDGTITHFSQWDPFALRWTDLIGLVTGSVTIYYSWSGLASSNHKLFLFSSCCTPNYFFVWDSKTFEWGMVQSNGSIPSPRTAPGFTSLAQNLYLLGGGDSNGNALGGFYRFDTVSNLWVDLSALTGTPSPRYLFGFAAMN